MRAHRHDEMPFDVEGWLSSPRVQRMSLAQRGAFFQLLCRAWADADCSLPDDVDELIFLAGTTAEEWEKTGAEEAVRRMFAPDPKRGGRLVNAKQLEVLAEQNRRLQSAKANRERVAKYRAGPNGKGEPTETASVPAQTKRHEAARPILHYLNEKAGVRYRETETNLGFIGARLAEPDVTPAGVRMMIDRQVRKWKGTDMEEYLRPETLFNATKFDGYYAAREQPIVEKEGQHAKTPGTGPCVGGLTVDEVMRQVL